MGAYDSFFQSAPALGDAANQQLDAMPLPSETPEDTANRAFKTAIRKDQQQRVTGASFAAAGIPTTQDSVTGDFSPIKDSAGVPLTNHDKKNSVAWDSMGAPQKIKRDPIAGTTTIAPAYTGVPNKTDKSGNQYEVQPGLPWNYTGQDADIVAKAAQKAKDHAISQAAIAAGGQLSLEQHERVSAEHDVKEATKALKGIQHRHGFDDKCEVGQAMQGAIANDDLTGAQAAIDSHFNTLYAASDANKTDGWLGIGGKPTQESTDLRAQLDKDKDAARKHAEQILTFRARAIGAKKREDDARAQFDTLERQKVAAQMHASGLTPPQQISTENPVAGDATPQSKTASGSVLPVIEAPPALSQPQQQNPAQTSPIAQLVSGQHPQGPAPEGVLGSLLRPVATGIVPALATAGGGLAGAAIGGIAGIPAGPAAIATGILGDIAGGAAGDAAGRKLQNAVMGGEWTQENQQQLAANMAAHPIAAKIGAFIPAAISMIGGGGGKAMKASMGKFLENSVAHGAEHPSYFAKAIAALPENMTVGARMGAAAATDRATMGEGQYSDAFGEAVKGAVTMGPVAFVQISGGLLGAVLGKAPLDAAILATSNALYEKEVHGKDVDFGQLAKDVGTDIPGFMLMNAFSALTHTKAPALPEHAPDTRTVPEDVQFHDEEPPAEAAPAIPSGNPTDLNGNAGNGPAPANTQEPIPNGSGESVQGAQVLADRQRSEAPLEKVQGGAPAIPTSEQVGAIESTPNKNGYVESPETPAAETAEPVAEQSGEPVDPAPEIPEPLSEAQTEPDTTTPAIPGHEPEAEHQKPTGNAAPSDSLPSADESLPKATDPSTPASAKTVAGVDDSAPNIPSSPPVEAAQPIQESGAGGDVSAADPVDKAKIHHAVFKSLLKKAKKVTGGLYELADKDVSQKVREKLLPAEDFEKNRYSQAAKLSETEGFSLHRKSEFTGDQYQGGWILKHKKEIGAGETQQLNEAFAKNIFARSEYDKLAKQHGGAGRMGASVRTGSRESMVTKLTTGTANAVREAISNAGIELPRTWGDFATLNFRGQDFNTIHSSDDFAHAMSDAWGSLNHQRYLEKLSGLTSDGAFIKGTDGASSLAASRVIFERYKKDGLQAFRDIQDQSKEASNRDMAIHKARFPDADEPAKVEDEPAPIATKVEPVESPKEQPASKSISDEPPAKSTPVGAVKSAVKALTAKFKGSAETVVVSDGSELPDAVKAHAEARGIALNRIGGVHHEGKVYLNAAGLDSPARAAEVFFHEQAGHHGVSKIIEGIDPGAAKSLAKILQNGFPEEWAHVSERYHADEHVDETLARIMEKFGGKEMDAKPRAFWNRALDYIRTTLAKAGFKDWSKGDVEALLRRGLDRVREPQDGGPDGGGKTKLSIEDPKRHEDTLADASRPTAITKAAEAETRERSGKKAQDPAFKASPDEHAEYAKQKLAENPDAGHALVSEILEAKTNARISPQDQALLLAHTTDINAKKVKQSAIVLDPKSTDAERNIADARWDQLESERNDAEKAANYTRSQWSNWGHMQKQFMKDDFSLAQLEHGFRKSNGWKPLTKEQGAKLQEHADEMERLYKEKAAEVDRISSEGQDKDGASKIADLSEDADKLDASESWHSDIIAAAKQVAEGVKKSLTTPINDIVARAKARLAGGAKYSIEGIPNARNEAKDDAIQYGAYLLASRDGKVMPRGEWIKELKSIFGEGVESDANEIWDGANKLHKDTISKVTSDILKTPEGAKAKEAKTKQTLKRKASKDDIVAAMKAKIGAMKPDDDMSGIRNHIDRLATQFIAEGITERGPLIDKIHDAVRDIDPRLTPEKVRELFSGYGKFTPAETDPLKVKKAQLRNEVQQELKLADMAKGDAAKLTGRGRPPVSEEGHRLSMDVEEALKKGGYKSTDPTKELKPALAAIQSRLSNEIADYEHAITERKPLNEKKNGIEYDQATKDLQALRDQRKAEYDTQFPKDVKTAKLGAISRGLDKRISEIEAQLKSGKVFPDKKASENLSSPEVDAKRDRLKALKAEREMVRSFDTARADFERMKEVKKRVDELEAEKAKGWQATEKPTLSTVDTPELAALKAEREKLLKARDEAQNGPRKTEEDARIAALEKAVADKTSKIAAGDTSTKDGKPTVKSADVVRLESGVSALNKQIEKLRHPEKPEEQARLEQLDKAIEKAKERIAKGELDSKPKSQNVKTAEVTAKEAELKALNAQMEDMRANDGARWLQRKTIEGMNRLADLNEKIATGDVMPKGKAPAKFEPDARLQEIQAQLGKRKREIMNMRAEAEHQNRSTAQKMLGFMVSLNRSNVLGHVTSLAHLSGAAVENIVTRPITGLAAQVMRATPLTDAIRKKAGYEGTVEGNLVGAKASLKSAKDVWQKVRTGESNIDLIHGDGKTYPKEWGSKFLEIPGHIHGAIKEPIRQGIFAQARYTGIRAAHEAGLRPESDPVLMQVIEAKAHQQANRDIFMGQSILTDATHSFTRSLRDNKIAPGIGKFMAAAIDFAFPVISVPTNIAIRTARHMVGLPEAAIRLGIAARKGELANNAERLSQADAELITRGIKYGTVGAALALYAWMHEDKFGGVYSFGKDSVKSPKGLNPGDIALPDGHHISHSFAHGPFGTYLNIIAAARRLYDDTIKKDPKSPWASAAGKSMLFASVADLKSLAIVSTPAQLLSPFKTQSQIAGNAAKNLLIPGYIQDAAKAMDGKQRKSDGFTSELKSGIPKLRETLPVKNPLAGGH